KWKSVAAELGYEGKRLHDGAIANELAPWVGTCPAGHLHYRYRKPTRALACGKCSKRFDPAHAISWEQRRVRYPRASGGKGFDTLVPRYSTRVRSVGAGVEGRTLRDHVGGALERVGLGIR